MDFEKFFNDLLDGKGVELNMNDFKKYVEKEKKFYIMKDFSNDEYYYLKLSDENKNLLDWLIDDIGLLDVYLISMDELEVETHEF